MPSRRTIAFALRLRPAMSRHSARVKPACNQTTARAVRSGSATARFLGTSSPNTIDSAVASRRASVLARAAARSARSPSAIRPGRISEATAGSAM